MSISPDGKLMAVAIADGNADIYRISKPPFSKIERLSKNNFAVSSVDFHPDGTFLAVGSHEHVRVWALVKGKGARLN